MKNKNSLAFALKPLKSAKVSEISEATAAAAVPANEKINFHIGNPLQDKNLVDRFFKIITALDLTTSDNQQELDESDRSILSFFYETIKNAVPYLPLGGYNVKKQPESLNYLRNWLSAEETLEYSFGDISPRECVFSSGGKYEFLRVFLTAISRFSVTLPVNIVSLEIQIPDYLLEIENLLFYENVNSLLQDRKNILNPTIIFIGSDLSEIERRKLKKSAEKYPVLFCEMNDASNVNSLARESGLKDKVIRFLSPAIFDPALGYIGLHFVLGNSDILQRFASVHFELKGTPSATELSFLEFYLKNRDLLKKSSQSENHEIFTDSEQPLTAHLSQLLEKHHIVYSDKVQKISRHFSNTSDHLLKRATGYFSRFKHYGLAINNDPVKREPAVQLFKNLMNDYTPKQIEQSFLNQFCKFHSQYEQQKCTVISGSSRTALSILGQHCGINNILTFDWSWSYDNGFDSIWYVPLLKKGKLNSAGLLSELEFILKENPLWAENSAVIINNPHNASGRVFSSDEIQSLIIQILDQNVRIIDDLCYQDVAPASTPVKFQTVKELALDAVKKGLLTSDKLKLLLTVHSLSKTDCYAGARITVAEICDNQILRHFEKVNANIVPNTMALFISYLFYRNEPAQLQSYWALRNKIFYDRSFQIKQAVDELPPERNIFNIELQEPEGSMYPHLIIHNFPSGISIDNISRRLAQRGFGLIPMTAFSKTAEGFEKARKSFRLTLGGLDDAKTLRHKTRRLAIELNRLLHEEAQAYREFRFKSPVLPQTSDFLKPVLKKWTETTEFIKNNAPAVFEKLVHEDDASSMQQEFINNYLPWRVAIITKRVLDSIGLYSGILAETQSRPAEHLIHQLGNEFYKEDILIRQARFKTRLFDRTVHPTQMFSLNVDLLVDRFLNHLVFTESSVDEIPDELTSALVEEYLGSNVPINSEQEAYELIFDLKSYIQTELFSDRIETPLLSFWGDWDGSTRPSGQGHRLIAAVLLENVRQLANFLHALKNADHTLHIENNLASDIQYLSKGIKKFWDLLNKITRLTNQLEKKYKGLLPGDLYSGRIRQLAVKLKIRRDPIHILLSHNNRLEKHMLKLRRERKESLEYYFELNKRLRKKLHDSIPNIISQLNNPRIALLAGSYRNLLKRFVLTPRIHQKTITSNDPFTIENTVHNLSEINQIGSRFGNPGLIVALQISMSTQSDALIELSRMISRKTESLNKDLNADSKLKNIWLVPLFEDQDSLNQLNGYLDDIWKFANRSRFVKQSVTERFQEIICEIFVAGSDLSQQVGQAKSWELYKQTKALFYSWLADKDLLGQLRIKLGSGEPMQRQGGYYSANSGKPVLWNDNINLSQLDGVLRPSARKNLFYAASPLKGVQSGGDIRTIQSNASEQIFRFLNLEQRAQLFFHISNLQKTSLEDLRRVSRTFKDTRMVVKDKMQEEINRLSGIYTNELYNEFLDLHSESFRQIIYGTDEDIIGIHVISYFISRMVPVLRDRPTVRPSKETSQLAGQKIVERIAQTLPLSRHGSLLRAIGHNRSQSMILGVNQLTTGLFRTLKMISDGSFKTNLSGILSHLPVAEILHDLRIYQQMDLKYIKFLEPAFNTGNSGLHALYEDMEYIEEFIPHLQRELIERQGLNAADFFTDNYFKEELLPFFRPDLAVLLQRNLFNTSPENILQKVKLSPDKEWLKRVNILLALPEKINTWRSKIWELIGSNIFQQVGSFVDLAKALTTISQKSQFAESTISLNQSKSNRLVNQINTLLRGAADDSMRQLLYSVVEFISRLPEDSAQIPIDTMRALQDIERIIKIDEVLLSNKEQTRLRYFILQIARLAGENG